MIAEISRAGAIYVHQRRELAEIFGFETRNKYEVLAEDGRQIGFCAEQQKGIFGFLMRQWVGHWRSFELHFFDTERNLVLQASHPFRIFFQALEVRGADGRVIGAIERRWGIFRKCFDVHDASGAVRFTVRSGFLSFWTFPILDARGDEAGCIRKRWSGLLKEMLTDADNFQLELGPSLTPEDRLLVLAASVYVDLLYFESKAEGGLRNFSD